MKMKIKRESVFLIGIIDLILAGICIGMLIAGGGNRVTPLGAVICGAAGLASIINSLE